MSELSIEQTVVTDYLLSEGLAPKFNTTLGGRLGDGFHLITVGPRTTFFYTPGPNGEEGFSQHIKTRDLETIKAVVAMLKEEVNHEHY